MKVTLHQIISPDGFSIENSPGYLSKQIALQKFEEWKKRFEKQGYYSSTKGRIPLKDLAEECTSEINQVEIYPKKCSHCGKGMVEGYCIEGGEKYFCQDECLHSEMTQEEFEAKYANGDGDSYWTEWRDEDIDLEDELILEENY